MKKLFFLLISGLLLSSAAEVGAAPASGYHEFVHSLDSIMAGAVLPVAEEQQILARMPGPNSSQATQVLTVARQMLGQPVVWGGASPAQGFDCSGLVQYVYKQAGLQLPRTADLQFLVGQTVAPSALRPGDLVYFTTYEPGASHVGIYIGQDQFIHTSFSQGIVAIGNMRDNYFVQRYYGSKRVV